MHTSQAPPIFTQRLAPEADTPGSALELSLALTADERTKSRQRFEAKGDCNQGVEVYLQLPRGTVLRGGDRLATATRQAILHITAKPESVLTVTADSPLALLKAAYHLGNRHAALEVTDQYLRLQPDPVLRQMLDGMGVAIAAEVAAFNPEQGAYHTHHPSHP